MASYKPIPSFTAQQIARFWDLVHRPSPGACWEWLGTIASGGYGHYGHFRAHRIAYALMKGEIKNRHGDTDTRETAYRFHATGLRLVEDGTFAMDEQDSIARIASSGKRR